jgi:hypothetical protein
MKTVNWNTAKKSMHDASGVENPETKQWEKTKGIYYPVLDTEKYARTCDQCNNGMNEGYCIDSGNAYYCSEECLHKNMSQAEYLELYDDGEGDSYWTEWEENDNEN